MAGECLRNTLDRVNKIAAWRLYMGCGACKWACQKGAISLKDIPETSLFIGSWMHLCIAAMSQISARLEKRVPAAKREILDLFRGLEF